MVYAELIVPIQYHYHLAVVLYVLLFDTANLLKELLHSFGQKII